MNYYDPEKAAKVWQRVQGSADTVASGMQGLLVQAVTNEKAYTALSRQVLAGGPILQKMARQEQKHIACLKGICALVQGVTPQIPTIPPASDTLDSSLRKCYRNALQSLAAYESRVSDPEYGPVFSQLAQEKRNHCLHLLALLGNYSK